MKEVNGNCLCGKIKYKFSSENLIAYQCHCAICRKSTGSAFSTTLIAQENKFEWTNGKENVVTFSKKGGYTVCFCSCCGSVVPNKFRGFPMFSVPVGGLDNENVVIIGVQIFLGSKAEWDKESMIGTKFQERPSIDEMFSLLHIK